MTTANAPTYSYQFSPKQRELLQKILRNYQTLLFHHAGTEWKQFGLSEGPGQPEPVCIDTWTTERVVNALANYYEFFMRWEKNQLVYNYRDNGPDGIDYYAHSYMSDVACGFVKTLRERDEWDIHCEQDANIGLEDWGPAPGLPAGIIKRR